MTYLYYHNPVEALGKLLREQEQCIEPIYSTSTNNDGEPKSVNVELRLEDFITKGEGTSLEEAKQRAALAMMEMIEASFWLYHHLKASSPSQVTTNKFCFPSPSDRVLRSAKKFWLEWRLQREVTKLLQQLVLVQGQNFSCLDGNLNKIRELCLDQDMENPASQLEDKLEKLPSCEVRTNETNNLLLTKEALEIYDKKVGKMTVIDRLGIDYSKSSLPDIGKKANETEAVTETTSDGSDHTFDKKSTDTFEEERDLPNQKDPESSHPFQASLQLTPALKAHLGTKIDEADEDKSNENERNGSKNKPTTIDYPIEQSLKLLRLKVQSGCGYEAEKERVLECLSEFGQVQWLKWGDWDCKQDFGGGKVKFVDASTARRLKWGNWGCKQDFDGGEVEFVDASTARRMVNRVFTVGSCTFHSSWRKGDLHLLKGPVPFQILLESDHLPFCWEKHMIVKNAMIQYGDVLAVDFIGRKRAVVSFSDECVVQNLVGCWWKVNGTPVLAKEVSFLTLS